MHMLIAITILCLIIIIVVLAALLVRKDDKDDEHLPEYFLQKFLSANSVDPDETLHHAAYPFIHLGGEEQAWD
ncbi:hypothetical protein DPMN_126627 [Dreissena polymorpha]|uniref:Uncharacterized protein n=1 Tax=Dreissena polymorpha TaxID=45954 RepID=A0A9D4H0H2_DREPO|nr:hypothetical protein DPMN_126627 [Dreissena polymorpha]